ncbi:MAG: MarR family transcriptional regulator [Prevotella sp.]|jgi:DNA-binding MarR family transcriptional regulator|nr:MarR family transcriptional regulator [Prevotella sp.]
MAEITGKIKYDDDLSYLIWQLIRAWRRGKRKALSEFGLTAPQMDVLGSIGCLQTNGRPITQIALSQHTDIDPMTISTILKNLQKKGLITRKECKTDKRVRSVKLTDSGSDLLQKAHVKAQHNRQMVFESIDEEIFKEQIKQLLSIINKLETQLNS